MVIKLRYSSNFTAKNILLTFQMEQNGTFLQNSKYDNWVLHKELVLDEIYTFVLMYPYLLKYIVVLHYQTLSPWLVTFMFLITNSDRK